MPSDSNNAKALLAIGDADPKSASDAAVSTKLKTDSPPAEYKCPISLEVMRDPVITPTGISYDRYSIEK